MYECTDKQIFLVQASNPFSVICSAHVCTHSPLLYVVSHIFMQQSSSLASSEFLLCLCSWQKAKVTPIMSPLSLQLTHHTKRHAICGKMICWQSLSHFLLMQILADYHYSQRHLPHRQHLQSHHLSLRQHLQFHRPSLRQCCYSRWSIRQKNCT